MKTKVLFSVSVFLGAFLLFQIQPLIGKYFLPWFGGAAAVWTTCLMFFQLLLLGGYAYAHALQRFAPRRQVVIHHSLLILTVLAGVVLCFVWGSPILPSIDWRAEHAGRPTWNVFRLLLISIGAAYFLLSTSASLLQAWFHRVEPTQSPYLFYIVSNTASLLALLSYPFLIEPVFTLKTQALLWSGGFFIYVVVCLLASRRVWPILTIESGEPQTNDEKKPGWRQYCLWISLAGCGVLALMAITNQMTQDIPPVPFLWILPLVLYLLTYIIAFIDRLCGWQDFYISLMGCAGLTAWYLMHQGLELDIIKQIAGYGFILFSICLFCHNALYRRKPQPRYLTNFYLSISLGGVLGGIFVAAIAPHLFRQYWEYQLCLIFAALLAVVSVYSNRRSVFYKARHALWVIVPIFAFFISQKALQKKEQSVYMERNFFGGVRVALEYNKCIPIYSLMHGQINHGMQIHHPKFSARPTTYFTETGGGGLAILNHPKRLSGEPMRVGLIGMGVGVLAAYGQAGDHYRFYEIDPTVIRLAQDHRWFSYLKDTKAEVEIVEGDGRISLERELTEGSNEYDILVVDVFSGDHIPAHILTLEAFELYLSHLANDGVIAINISNRYLDLRPVLWQVRDHYELEGACVYDQGNSRISADSTWVLLSRVPINQEVVRRSTHQAVRTIHPWTDQYSNLLNLLK